MASAYLRKAAFGLWLALVALAPAAAQSDADKVKLIESEAVGWSRNMDRLLAVFTDDVAYEDPGLGVSLQGKEQVRAFAQQFFDAFPDLKSVIISTVVSGDRAAAEWRLTGTQTGNLPGIPAANKQMDVRGVSTYEFQGGKIKRTVDYWDTGIMLRQLGVLPAKP